MKKMTVLMMALVLAFVAMPAVADIGGNPEETIQVEISVAPYAEINGLEDVSFEITEPEFGLSNTQTFQVLANFDYDVQVSDLPAIKDGNEYEIPVSTEVSGTADPGNTVDWDLTISFDDNDAEKMLLSDVVYSETLTVSVVED